MSAHSTFLTELVQRYPNLAPCQEDINNAYHCLVETYQNNGKLLIAGNGGSAADADHIVGELLKGFRSKRKLPQAFQERLLAEDAQGGPSLCEHLQGSLPAIALTSQSAIITATANDMDGKYIFAQQIIGYGKPGDTLLAISTSGNSENLLLAITVAKALGVKVIGLTGENGGEMLGKCDVHIKAPEASTAYAQELHLPIYHALCSMLEATFFDT